MCNSHGQEDAAPGVVRRMPPSRRPSSASAGTTVTCKRGESRVRQDERPWRHHTPARCPGSTGTRRETPKVANPRQPTPVHPLLVPVVTLAPGCSPAPPRCSAASYDGGTSPKPARKPFPRAESLGDSRALPDHSNRTPSQQLVGSSTVWGWHQPSSGRRVRCKAPPGRVTEQSQCSLCHTPQVLRCPEASPRVPHLLCPRER